MPEIKLVERQFAPSYPKFRFGSWNHCAYCGATPTGTDHAIPMAYISCADRRWNHSAADKIGPQTPACHFCNVKLLNKKGFDSFEERCRFVSDRLRRIAIRSSAVWSENEIQQLRDKLQSFVRFKRQEKSDFQERANWFYTLEYYRNLENLLYEPLLIKGEEAFHKAYYEYFRTTIAEITRRLDFGKARSRSSENTYR